MATQTVTATYQEIYDLSTRAGTLSIVGIHTPQGLRPYSMLEGFFRQYKKFKYNGITRMVLQPAAQLPADPLQVSLEAGETLDPRDLLNPILYHGARGDSINAALNVIYKRSGFTFSTDSTDTIDLSMFTDVDGQVNTNAYVNQMYYSALSDPSFRKFGVQQVIDLGPFVPLVNRVNASMYFGPQRYAYDRGAVVPDASQGKPGVVPGSSAGQVWDGTIPTTGSETIPTEMTWQQFFTNGTAELGWMPTRDINAYDPDNVNSREEYVVLPKLYMGVLIFPPSYNQRLYFRCVITHSFSFSDFGTFQPYELSTGSGNTAYWNNMETSNVSGKAVMNSMSLDLQEADAILETAGVL